MAYRLISRTGLWTLAGLVVMGASGAGWMTWMPGTSVQQPLPTLSAAERALSTRLEADVRALSAGIGERSVHTAGSMAAAVERIEARLREAGYSPERQTYKLEGSPSPRLTERPAHNLVAEVPGTQQPGTIVVIGAHYDSVAGSPGADDNASGVAALLALADWFRERPQPRTLRFVAFANEEPPWFLSRDMGSYVHAARSRARGERIGAMMALDGIGYFTDEPGTQQYPAVGIDLIYPTRGNFIGFITRVRDADLLRRAIGAFREQASVPSEGAALPGEMPGVGWSDHWSFWEHDYPAFLVTDTLPFRYPYYHTPRDTADRLDYGRMARVVDGLKAVIDKLAGSS